jgi:biotin carboxylase
VEACEKAGIAFLGPTAATMRMFSRKHTAREFAQSANVPVLPGMNMLAVTVRVGVTVTVTVTVTQFTANSETFLR